MRYFYLLLACCCFFIAGFAQADTLLTTAPQHSRYTLIYRLKPAQALDLVAAKPLRITLTLLGQPVDSFRHDAPTLAPGNYVFAQVRGNQLHTQLVTRGNLEAKMLSQEKSTVLVWHDSSGNTMIPDQVWLGKRPWKVNPQWQGFNTGRSRKARLIRAMHNGVVYTQKLEGRSRRSKSVGYRNGYYNRGDRWAWLRTSPLVRWLNEDWREEAAEKREQDRRRNPDKYRQHKGFLVYNQPRFKPGDTLRWKAFLVNRRQQPLTTPLLLCLTENYSDEIDTVLATVQPFRPGAYEGFVVLNKEALRLRLDQDYKLILLTQAAYDRMEKDADDDDWRDYLLNEFVQTPFEFEDYKLDQLTLSARAIHEKHHLGEQPVLMVKATDDNGLPVLDGRLRISLIREGMASDFADRLVRVPQRLWTHEQPLDPVGETSIRLPDSIFPKASFSYRAQIELINSNNEVRHQSLMLRRLHKPAYLKMDMENDSLRLQWIDSGRSSATTAWLTGLGPKGDTLFSHRVLLPGTHALHPLGATYHLWLGDAQESFSQRLPSPLRVLAARTKDSVWLQVSNPQNIPFWYTIYHGNQLIHQGRAQQHWRLVEKPRGSRPYSIGLHYLQAGQMRRESFYATYEEQRLMVEQEMPAAASPGAQVPITITVRNADGMPVADADVTALSFTQKFKYSHPLSLPYFGRAQAARKRFASGYLNPFSISQSDSLDYARWAGPFGLDGHAFYQFIYPQPMFQQAVPAVGNITQVAPFVCVNGKAERIHYVFIDEQPHYFAVNNLRNGYSFPVEPGYHRIRLRTRDALVTLDSVFVPQGKKLIVSAQPSAEAHKQITILPMPDSLVGYEKLFWSRYMMLVEHNFGQRPALVHAQQMFALSPAETMSIVGPVSTRSATFQTLDSLSQSFEVEGGFRFRFSPGLVRQRQVANMDMPAAFAYPRIQSKWMVPMLRDSVLSFQHIRRGWQDQLFRRSRSTRLFPSMRSDHQTAQLQVGAVESEKALLDQVEMWLLFRHGNTDFMEAIPGEESFLGNFQPGNYQLLALLRDGRYALIPTLRLGSDTLTYTAIDQTLIKPADTTSQRLLQLIYQKHHKELRQADNTDMRATFNAQYLTVGDLQYEVAGIVRDQQGKPIAGSSIQIKGTQFGTVSAENGRFKLKTPGEGTLVVSAIGYDGTTVAFSNGQDIEVILLTGNQRLEDVVVVGYGMATRRREFVGALSVHENVLQGKAAGIMVRGIATSGESTPLLIVVGNPFSGKMDDLDAADIEEITVMKQADATAAFGVAGAGGVIVITTKKGKARQAMNLDAPVAMSSLRKQFRDHAYWQPRLRTNEQGQARFIATLPDDITAWRTQAIAATADARFGEQTGSLRSFKRISTQLSLPSFALAGDSLKVLAKLQAYGGDSLQAFRRWLVNGQQQSASRVGFRYSLPDSLALMAGPAGDTLRIGYTARFADGSEDGEERLLPQLPVGSLESIGWFATLRGDTVLQMAAIADSGMAKLYLEASLLPTFERELERLRRYEHLCNEQAASKLVALLQMERLAKLRKQNFKGGKDIEKLLALLGERQNADGLYGWYGKGQTEDWISLHVLQTLAQAEQQGHKAKWNQQAAISHLMYGLWSQPFPQMLSRLRMLKSLKAAIDFRAAADSLQQRFLALKKPSVYQQAQLAEYQAQQGLQPDLTALLGKPYRTLRGNAYWGDEGATMFWGSAVHTTLAVYRTLQLLNQHQWDNEIIGFLLEQKNAYGWANTYDAATILETILPTLVDSLGQVLASSISLQGQSIQQFPHTQMVSASQPFSLSKKGKLPLYASLSQERWNPQPQPISNHFSVSTSFTQSGHSVQRLQAGVRYELKAQVVVRQDAEYVLVELPIPAGCVYDAKPQPWGEEHREYFKHKTAIFLRRLPRGTHHFSIPLQARFSGVFTLNPAKVEPMYFPTLLGRNGIQRLTID